MKISCKVIEDLLPLYYDGVCSGESRQLVEGHLESCESCKSAMEALRGVPEYVQLEEDDLKPLENIRTQWKQARKRSMRRGAAIVLAVLMSVVLIWGGIWYTGLGRYYAELAAPMERVPDENRDMTSVTHMAVVGEHGVLLKKPIFLSDSGIARVGHKSMTTDFVMNQNPLTVSAISADTVITELFLYPQFGGGYRYALQFIYTWRNGLGQVWVNPDLTLDFEHGFYTPDEIAEYEALLEENRKQIEGLFEAAYALWGIPELVRDEG